MRRTLPLAALLLLASCGSDAPRPKSPLDRAVAPPSERGQLPGPPGLPVATLASLARANAPTAFAAGHQGGLFVFVSDGKLFARKIEEKPGPREPVALGPLPNLGVALSVKAREDGSFAVFWSEKVDQNHVFKVQLVAADGKPQGSALTLPPVAEASLAYADLAITGERALVLYELVKDERSSVLALPLSLTPPAADGPAKPLLEGALAWHATQTDKGLAVAVVRSDQPFKEGAPALGRLEVITVDEKGVASAPRLLLAEESAQIDVEIAALAGGLVVAWTDESIDEGAVRVATLGPDGSPKSPPKWVAPPIGQQAFVGLTSNPKGKHALIAWENVGQTAGSSRVLSLATIAADGVVGAPRTRLLLDDADRPDLVPDGDGFAALTLAPARLREAKSGDPAPSWPTMVRIGSDLSIKWSEPVRFMGARAKDGVPDLAWALSCQGKSCFALAADDAAPASFFLVGSAERESPWQAPAWKADDERPPKVLALRSWMEGARVAAAHAQRFGQTGNALAWVTYHLEGSTPQEAAPKGEAPFAATLGLRLSTDGAAAGAPVIISKRALSVGGVSVAESSSGKKAEVVVAWVASEKSGAQVYATRVDDGGKKVLQKKITVVARDKKEKGRDPGVPSSVAIAHSPAQPSAKGTGGAEGHVLAWVDPRDKNGEVYVARLNKELEKVVVDKRVTQAAGDAADVHVTVRGSDAFVVFADARQDKGAGAGPVPSARPSTDIYFAHLDAFSLKEIDEDARVYASLGPSRSPRLATAGNKLLLAWIEESSPGENKPATMRVGEVDSAGRLVGAPKVIAAPEAGSVSGFGFTCGATLDSCRVVLSWGTTDGRLELGALNLDAVGAAQPIVKLGTLASGPFAEPSFSFADGTGKQLFFAEDLGERGRIRQVELGW